MSTRTGRDREKIYECGTCINEGKQPYAINIDDKDDLKEMINLSKSNSWICKCKGGYLKGPC